jgi:tryptophan-rich sensory protein
VVYFFPDDFFCYRYSFLYYPEIIEIMSGEFIRFSLKIVIAAFTLTISAALIFYFYIPGKYLPVLPWMLLFFMIASLASHGYQRRLANKDMGKFIRSSMIMSVLRLVMYSAFAIIYLALNNENAAVFVVSLVVVYMIFTFIEVSDLARITRR